MLSRNIQIWPDGSIHFMRNIGSRFFGQVHVQHPTASSRERLSLYTFNDNVTIHILKDLTACITVKEARNVTPGL